MGNKNFEQAMDPREHIESDLTDSGAVAPEEWREAFNLEGRPEFSHIGLIEAFLNTTDGGVNTDPASYQKELKQIKDIKDSGEKLQAVRNMSLSQALEFVRLYGTNGAFNYLNGRLTFYKKLINGEEISVKEKSTDWDVEKEEFITKTISRKEKKEGAANPQTIAVGLWRDIYYAAMQGTPEMAAVKIATRKVNEEGVKTKKNIEKAVVKLGSNATPYNAQFLKLQDRARDGLSPRSVVQFRGYESGVSGNSIGVYGALTSLYKECEKEVKGRTKQKGGVAKNDTEEAEVEHRTVLLMAGRLKGAFEYGGLVNESYSSYHAGLKEAIVAGRLGHKVMRQMRGMRQKIQSTNFENIARFIGKSGDNRYENEKKRLDKLIGFLSDANSHPHSETFNYGNARYKHSMITGWAHVLPDICRSENEDAIMKQARWFANETEKLDKKFERAKAEIEKANLPAEEKGLQLQSVIVNHESAKATLQTDYNAEFARLNARTPEQLLPDLKMRQEMVNARYEKRKSLAQKALDLHFRINHTGRDYDSKPLGGIVDWINDAPLGTIKRAHKMMRKGMKDESVVELAVADIVCSKRGVTRDDLRVVHDILGGAGGQGDAAVRRETLKRMTQVASSVKSFGYDLPINEIADLANKDITGMSEALRIYNLDQVRNFMNKGAHLPSMAEVHRITEKFGHHLPAEEIAEMASHKIGGLEEAFRCFSLEEIKTLLSRDVNMRIAVIVSDNAKQFNYAISIERVAQASKTGPSSFERALQSFSLPDIDAMLDDGVNLDEYFRIKDIVARKEFEISHDALLLWTRKLCEQQYHSRGLERIIELYGIDKTGKIITEGFKLLEILNVLQVLEKDGISSPDALELTMSVVALDRATCMSAIDKYNLSLKGLIWLSERFTPPLEPALHEALSIFGEDMLTIDQYTAFRKLANGEPVPEMTALGINKVGKEGVSQLREKISEFRKRLLSDQLDVELIQKNPILNGIVKTLVRFDQSSWRQNGSQKFNDVLKSYQGNRDTVKPLPFYMSPSDVRRIDLVDKKQNFQFSEPFLARFGYLHNQLKSAFELYQESKTPFSDLAERAEPLIDKIVKDLEQKKLAITKPEAQKGIQMRIDALKNLDIRAVRKFQDTIRVLSQFNELKDILLQTVFVASLRKNKGYHERVAEQVRNAGPNTDSMSFMLDFIDHVTNKETLKQYFSDKQSYNAFKGIVDVKAIEEELARIQNQKTIGTVPVQFVPTRNLLTEFSGDIADACWTGKYDSILEDYPNFSSVTFVQDPGGANERYVGAALLIETTSEEGEKLLVVRGLNPLENTINRLSVSDFFSQFTDWVKKTAAKDDRKAALVVDNHSGGSGTNRPILHQHMVNLKAEKVALASTDDTSFNGYNIVNKCVLI